MHRNPHKYRQTDRRTYVRTHIHTYIHIRRVVVWFGVATSYVTLCGLVFYCNCRSKAMYKKGQPNRQIIVYGFFGLSVCICRILGKDYASPTRIRTSVFRVAVPILYLLCYLGRPIREDYIRYISTTRH